MKLLPLLEYDFLLATTDEATALQREREREMVLIEDFSPYISAHITGLLFAPPPAASLSERRRAWEAD